VTNAVIDCDNRHGTDPSLVREDALHKEQLSSQRLISSNETLTGLDTKTYWLAVSRKVTLTSCTTTLKLPLCSLRSMPWWSSGSQGLSRLNSCWPSPAQSCLWESRITNRAGLQDSEALDGLIVSHNNLIFQSQRLQCPRSVSSRRTHLN
jgi:hypothetical protein